MRPPIHLTLSSLPTRRKPSGSVVLSGETSPRARIVCSLGRNFTVGRHSWVDPCDKIRAVGNLLEVIKAAPMAPRTDLEGKSLFPGFIDSHSHTIDGGFNLINADATEKVDTFEELQAFVAAAKKTGRGLHGDILEILGLSLKFWSHTDLLNRDFSTGAYEKQCLVFRGMDGHTAWANHAMLQRAGISADYLKALSADQRSYFGYDKGMQPNGFLVDAGQHKVDRLMPPPTDSEILAAGRAALEYNYSLGITAWLEPSAPESTLKAYKVLNERGELNNEVVAFPKVLAKDPPAELAFVHKQQQIYGNTVYANAILSWGCSIQRGSPHFSDRTCFSRKAMHKQTRGSVML